MRYKTFYLENYNIILIKSRIVYSEYDSNDEAPSLVCARIETLDKRKIAMKKAEKSRESRQRLLSAEMCAVDFD